MTTPPHIDGYDTYRCDPCNGTGRNDDPTLADNIHREAKKHCPFCHGNGVIYTLKGFRKRRYAGERIN